LIGFDTFGDEYPTTGFSEDLLQRQHWIDTAGGSSIGVSQLEMCLDRIGATNYQLVSGDATSTIPDFVEQNPGLRIALLNLDIDFMEPTMAALTSFWDRVVPGGIVLLDNYSGEGSSGVSLFGDTQAIDEFFRDKDVSIQRLSFVARPCFVRKPGGSRPVDPFTVKM